MLDQRIEPTIQDDTPGEAPPGQDEEFYIPPHDVKSLTDPPPLPRVKRFNRRTAAILLVVFGFVAILSLSKAFRPRTIKTPPPDNAQISAARNPSPDDMVAHLPGSYAQVPKLGRPLPGDIGVIARDAASRTAATGGTEGVPGEFAQTPRAAAPLTPLQQYEQQQQIDALKQQQAALESHVSFSGGSGNADSPDIASLLPGGNHTGAMPVAANGQQDGGSSFDRANQQAGKDRFLNQRRTGKFKLHHGVYYPTSPFTLQAGTIIPGVLETGINSDLPGQIKGRITENVYDTVTGTHLLLPQGTVLLGTYDSHVTYGQSRVLVVWTRICRPDGSCIDTEGMPGTDLSGYAGLTGKLDRHYLQLLGGVVVASILGAGTQMATGANTTTPNFGQLAAQGAAITINNAGQQITRKELNVQPTIIVHPGERFTVFTTKDMVIPPYRG
ncbi:MAG: hypothetical protein M0T84_13445 [Betaproteobacteria bacterium]|nr:hypothetical protein [Betaproteobacteria bacterium]